MSYYRILAFIIIECALLLMCNFDPAHTAPSIINVRDSSLKSHDVYWWYENRKFYFKAETDSGVSTTIVFDTINIVQGDNSEFVRYYFYKDIHKGCLIDYTITTDTIFNGQITSKFILKVNKFYPDPKLKIKL